MESYCSENVSRINIENSTDQLMSGLCKESPEMCCFEKQSWVSRDTCQINWYAAS